jgi:hypothetical protein
MVRLALAYFFLKDSIDWSRIFADCSFNMHLESTQMYGAERPWLFLCGAPALRPCRQRLHALNGTHPQAVWAVFQSMK